MLESHIIKLSILFRNSITSLTPSIFQDNYRDELVDRGAKIALVVYPRTAQATKELSVIKGEYLEVSWNPIKVYFFWGGPKKVFVDMKREIPGY